VFIVPFSLLATLDEAYNINADLGSRGVSALITPQDVISMLMMLVPLYLLYELGIQLIVWVPVSKVAGKKDE